jgi:hypothetical protein
MVPGLITSTWLAMYKTRRLFTTKKNSHGFHCPTELFLERGRNLHVCKFCMELHTLYGVRVNRYFKVSAPASPVSGTKTTARN